MQCQAITDWCGEEQCSRRGKIKIDGFAYCIPHAGKICLQRAIKDGAVEAIDPNDWFYKKAINKKIKVVT